MTRRAILLHPDDNVATLVEPALPGDMVEVGGLGRSPTSCPTGAGQDSGAAAPDVRGPGDNVHEPGDLVTAVDSIAVGHKVALSCISQGAVIVKYEAPIGVAVADIPRGAHVHVHNTRSVRGKYLAGERPGRERDPDHVTSGTVVAGDAPAALREADLCRLPGPRQSSFKGFLRQDGSAGVRNHLLVLPVVICAGAVADAIAAGMRGAVSVYHQHGCNLDPATNADAERVFAGFGRNPNVGAVILVSLGCETVSAERVAGEIARSGKPVELVVIQRDGGSAASIRKGRRIARRLARRLESEARVEIPVNQLTVGVECGASDAFSGLSANPAAGVMSDILVRCGGTVVLSETTEMIGAEHILVGQARSEDVGRALLGIVHRTEGELAQIGGSPLGDITPGNIEGGLSTIEEKSLGCIRKAGTSPIQEVVGYGYAPSARGLVVMDTPGHDIESMTGMVAGGAQVIVFTTGRGTPTGNPIAPVIKVASNSLVARSLPDVIDVHAGDVLEGSSSLDATGIRIFEHLLAVASGRLTFSEKMGHREFALRRHGTVCTLY